MSREKCAAEGLGPPTAPSVSDGVGLRSRDEPLLAVVKLSGEQLTLVRLEVCQRLLLKWSCPDIKTNGTISSLMKGTIPSVPVCGVPFLPYILIPPIHSSSIHLSNYRETAGSHKQRKTQKSRCSTCSTKSFVLTAIKLGSTGGADVRGQIHPQTSP